MGSIVDPLSTPDLIDLCIQYRVHNATLSALYDLIEEGSSTTADAKIRAEQNVVQNIGSRIATYPAANTSELRMKVGLIPTTETDDFECVSDLLNASIVRSIFRDLTEMQT